MGLGAPQNCTRAPEVTISHKTLQVGQEFTILYQQCFNQPVYLSRFTRSQVFREELFQRALEDDHVDTVERMVNTCNRVHEDIPGGLFYDKRSFTIPKDSIPSFMNQLKNQATHPGKW